MATQGINPMSRHTDDILKDIDSSRPVTAPPIEDENPSDGRGGDRDAEGKSIPGDADPSA